MMTNSPDGATPEWMTRFLDALRASPRIRAAARAAGVPLSTAYYHRSRDAAFLKAWDACLPRGDPGAAGLPGQRGKGVARLDRFLEVLAETSNVTAAAETAGIAPGTIYRLRRGDPGFARRWYAALAEGYDNLEMELLGRLRAGEGADAGGGGGASKSRFDTATALRCLTAHRESVAREKGRRTLAEEATTIASINAKIDALRTRQKSNRHAIAAARKAKAEAMAPKKSPKKSAEKSKNRRADG